MTAGGSGEPGEWLQRIYNETVRVRRAEEIMRTVGMVVGLLVALSAIGDGLKGTYVVLVFGAAGGATYGLLKVLYPGRRELADMKRDYVLMLARDYLGWRDLMVAEQEFLYVKVARGSSVCSVPPTFTINFSPMCEEGVDFAVVRGVDDGATVTDADLNSFLERYQHSK